MEGLGDSALCTAEMRSPEAALHDDGRDALVFMAPAVPLMS